MSLDTCKQVEITAGQIAGNLIILIIPDELMNGLIQCSSNAS